MPEQAITNITEEHRDWFFDLHSGDPSLALFSCFLNGSPTAAIVKITEEKGEYVLSPLFVAVTPDMVLTDHEGREP